MKKLALGTLMIAGLLVACGGGDSDDVTPLPDANTNNPDASSGACNPLSPPGQQGCLTGQKCTWVTVQDTPDRLGRVACVADGTVALGGACTVGAAGETTGFDDCQAGLYCINGECRDVCGLQGQANGTCETGYNCTRYADTFANGDDDPAYGVCNPGCNPVTQIRTGSSPPAGCGANMGCYMLVSQTESIAVCAGAGSVMANNDITGTVYANSCVPGAQPRRKDPNVTTSECGGLCAMVDVYQGMNTQHEGGMDGPTPGGGLPDPADNCQTRWGAAPPADGTAGESCRYWWSREPFDTLGTYSNSLGWCFKHAVYDYDPTGGNNPTVDFPRCTTLTTGDVVQPIGDPPHNDAIYFWCHAVPAMLQNASNGVKKWHARHEPKLDRLVDNWRYRN